MLINIQDDIIRLHSAGLLDKLLIDKTTKKNIMWATDAYASLGKPYERNEEITVPLITGQNNGIIKTRARKEFEQQSARTRQHAEVFTPLWVCSMMNDYADEEWFGRKDVFTLNGEPTERILFGSGQDWKKYVDSRRLEITCGEAPYLISRYDVATGEVIPIEKRIGILDRKLRVVNENAETEDEWIRWAIRAFQATYGYEFQGDNLLIARVNMMMTFAEYLESRWHRKPTAKEGRTIVNVTAWNLWQMDGLTGTIPYRKAQEEYQQMTLFDLFGMGTVEPEEERQPYCRIYDWRSNESIDFNSMKNGGTAI